MNNDLELRELRSFVAVASSKSFTEAAQILGLSQSALSRQIQGMEDKLGCLVFSRTTRSLRLTQAGVFWLARCRSLLGQTESALEEFSNRFSQLSSVVHVGCCKSIGLAYLPGFFHSFRRHFPENQVHLNQSFDSNQLLDQLDRCELDIVIMPQPNSLPPGIEITHSFDDQFVVITPPDIETFDILTAHHELQMIGIDRQTSTGKLIENWWVRHKAKQAGLAPMMEFDNFDLIINSVALGLGYAFVPRRALAIYSKNRKFNRHSLPTKLCRELGVLARAEQKRPKHIQAFVDHILF